MPTGLKALIVILAIAVTVFAGAKPIMLRHMNEVAFHRRRNAWFALTVLAFFCPSIWLYAAFALPILFFTAKRDDNPLAVYGLLMFVIPNAGVSIPTVAGIGQLFELTHYRMMSLVILLPLLFRKRDPKRDLSYSLTVLDSVVLCYCLLQVFLFVQYESDTNTLRRALLQFLDTFLVFYAFARARPTRQAIGEIVACFALAFSVLAGIAVFESVRGWLLYESIPTSWGVDGTGYLQRGDALRAQATAGHSLILGYVMCLAIGFWLYIQSQQTPTLRTRVIMLMLWAGLMVSYSRGAWLTGALLLVIFLALRPGAVGLLVKVVPLLAGVGVILYLSPLKETILDRLPFIGTADQDTVDYRRQLFEVSWRLIQINPLFGDPFVANNMEELRQGQGIIDIINAFLAVTLFSGFVGLSLFVATFVIALWRCYVTMKRWMVEDPSTASLGVALVACMSASLFFMATAGVGPVEYLLTGLLASYSYIAIAPHKARETAVAQNLQPLNNYRF